MTYPKPQYRDEIGEQAKSPCVSICADAALESASKAHSHAEDLLAELRQQNHENGVAPCRSGIDGKLMDARDHSDATLRTLQEIRTYLLG